MRRSFTQKEIYASLLVAFSAGIVSIFACACARTRFSLVLVGLILLLPILFVITLLEVTLFVLPESGSLPTADYIFLDFLNDVAMTRDNTADYQTMIQISVTTKDFEKRKTLVPYIQKEFLSAPSFMKSQESEYYIAQFTIGVILTEDNLSV